MWFHTHGFVRISPARLWYFFVDEPYYLVVSNGTPNEVICFFDAKYYEWKEEMPALR